jgi:hypothetical protein
MAANGADGRIVSCSYHPKPTGAAAWNPARRPAIAFLGSDRPDRQRPDERNGDQAQVRLRRVLAIDEQAPAHRRRRRALCTATGAVDPAPQETHHAVVASRKSDLAAA